MSDPIRLISTCSSFDEALALARDGDTIVLGSGATYETYGPWASPGGNINCASGVTIDARGARIVLRPPPGITRPDRDLPILRCGSNVTITGGTWDCNYSGCAGWFTQGIRFHGRFEITDAVIVGMSGSRNSGTPTGAVESFAISSEGDTGGSKALRCVVRDCKVDSSDDYVSGIYMGATVNTSVVSLVQECSVDLGLHGQFAYSSNQPTNFVRCTGVAARWWYNDTGPTRSARILGCRGVGHYAVISCVATPGAGLREVATVGGCFFGERAVEWWDQSGGQMSGGVACSKTDFSACTYFVSSASKTGTLLFDHCTLGNSTAFYASTDSVRATVDPAPVSASASASASAPVPAPAGARRQPNVPKTVRFGGELYTLYSAYKQVSEDPPISEGPFYARPGVDPADWAYMPDAAFLASPRPLERPSNMYCVQQRTPPQSPYPS